MSAPVRPAGKEAPQAISDRLLWNLGIFMLIPVLVLLLAAVLAVRFHRSGTSRPKAAAPSGTAVPAP